MGSKNRRSTLTIDKATERSLRQQIQAETEELVCEGSPSSTPETSIPKGKKKK